MLLLDRYCACFVKLQFSFCYIWGEEKLLTDEFVHYFKNRRHYVTSVERYVGQSFFNDDTGQILTILFLYY